MTTGSDSRADAWLERARAKLGAAALGPRAEQIGRVEEIGDGIALVSGLPNVRLDELLRFDKGQFGFAQVLERDRVGCVLLDDVDLHRGRRCGARHGRRSVRAGRTGPAGPGRRSARTPARRERAGRSRRFGTYRAAGARDHRPRSRDPAPVQTGLLVVDTLFALGRGYESLIIGRPRHRQDHYRDRHDHQSEDERYRLRLRRGRL